MLHGSYTVLEHLRKKLGIEPGEVTPDGMFSFEEAECLGCGRKPPVMLVNDKRFEGVTPELVDEIIEKAKKGELQLD
jgi:NADH:ubiquinone oxidoreductase subunit E